MKRGSALFMHRRTMHSSLRNLSDGVRWSFDLRYQPIGQPTGRPWFPAFVARSRRDPSRRCATGARWADLWQARATSRSTPSPAAPALDGHRGRSAPDPSTPGGATPPRSPARWRRARSGLTPYSTAALEPAAVRVCPFAVYSHFGAPVGHPFRWLPQWAQ